MAAGNPNWKNGVSGNPSGRKKIDPKIKKALEAALPEAVKVLVALLKSKDEDIRLKAANSICDRNLGKPVQAISDPEGNAISGIVVIRAANEPKNGSSAEAVSR